MRPLRVGMHPTGNSPSHLLYRKSPPSNLMTTRSSAPTLLSPSTSLDSLFSVLDISHKMCSLELSSCGTVTTCISSFSCALSHTIYICSVYSLYIFKLSTLLKAYMLIGLCIKVYHHVVFLSCSHDDENKTSNLKGLSVQMMPCASIYTCIVFASTRQQGLKSGLYLRVKLHLTGISASVGAQIANEAVLESAIILLCNIIYPRYA
ncbi:unnamed protein product [Strongylus vulgaris]|uniref:Uncharacterized protein n=1 Tax=Strongylus vulgaris TaxID=40348 RepID=A0A3P7INT6_STRVU|nr:unnamed protein product [Strongylus vulgaris]